MCASALITGGSEERAGWKPAEELEEGDEVISVRT